MKKIRCILNEGETTTNDWENDASDLLYILLYSFILPIHYI